MEYTVFSAFNDHSIASYGSLDALLIKSKTSEEVSTAIILLHGAGANMYDLAPVFSDLHQLGPYHIISLQAPFAHPLDPSQSARLWFPIEEVIAGLAKFSGDLSIERLESIPTPVEYNISCQKIAQAISSIQSQYAQCILIGFSQGGMIALHYALQNCVPCRSMQQQISRIKALALFSTTVTPPVVHVLDQIETADLPVFQCHGLQDHVLPYIWGKLSCDLISPKFSRYKFLSFVGEHTIPPSALEAFQSWIVKL